MQPDDTKTCERCTAVLSPGDPDLCEQCDLHKAKGITVDDSPEARERTRERFNS